MSEQCPVCESYFPTKDTDQKTPDGSTCSERCSKEYFSGSKPFDSSLEQIDGFLK